MSTRCPRPSVADDTLLCTRCRKHPRAPRQRWCQECRAEYKRHRRQTLQRSLPVPHQPDRSVIPPADLGPLTPQITRLLTPGLWEHLQQVSRIRGVSVERIMADALSTAWDAGWV
jgi:hypothetical protein